MLASEGVCRDPFGEPYVLGALFAFRSPRLPDTLRSSPAHAALAARGPAASPVG